MFSAALACLPAAHHRRLAVPDPHSHVLVFSTPLDLAFRAPSSLDLPPFPSINPLRQPPRLRVLHSGCDGMEGEERVPDEPERAGENSAVVRGYKDVDGVEIRRGGGSGAEGVVGGQRDLPEWEAPVGGKEQGVRA
ncbi:hypothetical protein C1H76_2703 [Elsinoe australis]|uniref:Uncharacterized protein n=1 Tax=Elsinoe australis TaxID=40998 RepID=A0A4U7BB25_9PEZI|nr:hypothetical protein C1H76_2703 [Elsinoe australis]